MNGVETLAAFWSIASDHHRKEQFSVDAVAKFSWKIHKPERRSIFHFQAF